MLPAVHRILTEHRRNTRVTVLASGDPMLYGVGVLLTRDLPSLEFRVLPQVSAFSLACARLGWPAADTTLISLVNRPIQQMLPHLHPGQRLVLFSEDGSTPAIVAQLLKDSGYARSEVNVFESLGGPAERSIHHTAADWPPSPCGNLNLIAVLCMADRTCAAGQPASPPSPLSLAPGLPDEAFDTDGQLTRREVRAITLARLAPLPCQTLWDVGAGTGSVAIEWMRLLPSCSSIAFEARPDRALRIRRNAARLGAPGLRVIEGPAPHTFSNLPQPHAIFLGGGVANDSLFEACWAKLLPGGRLVANAVTLESEAALAARHKLYGGDLIRISVSRADPVGRFHAWRPMMPITQWTVTRP